MFVFFFFFLFNCNWIFLWFGSQWAQCAQAFSFFYSSLFGSFVGIQRPIGCAPFSVVANRAIEPKLEVSTRIMECCRSGKKNTMNLKPHIITIYTHEKKYKNQVPIRLDRLMDSLTNLYAIIEVNVRFTVYARWRDSLFISVCVFFFLLWSLCVSLFPMIKNAIFSYESWNYYLHSALIRNYG